MRIGIALGGGGARGGAHLGVLLELERLGIRPDLMTGTSIGGLIGAFYAAGVPVVEIGRFLQRMTLANALALAPTANPQALTLNHRFAQMIEQMIGRPTFDELDHPLALVAVDLHTQQEVVLDDGDVVEAVLATTALPVLLPPVQRDEHLLIDGGLLNNTPFDVARARGATHTIAIDLSNTATFGAGEIPKASGLVARSFTVLAKIPIWQVGLAAIDVVARQTFYSRLAIVQPEIVIRPYLGTIGLLDFHRFDEAFAAGQTAVREIEAEIVAVMAGERRAAG